MHKIEPPNVLVLARDGETARRWREALAPAVAHVWLAEAEISPGHSPDVVVTDRTLDEGTSGAAVLGIGAVRGAVFTLPADCTDRELAQGVLLLADNVRLRAERDELARVHEEVKTLAQTDPLTGLANRRSWDRHLAGRLAHVHRPLWLAVVDLDNFKQVNDRLGMTEGDKVLAQAARALAGQLRREDVVARLGGDEFGLLLDEMTEDNLRRVFDRLRAAVAEASPEGVSPVTASIGYTQIGQSAIDAAALFTAAERAMREAKRAGGNRAVRAISS